jgi:hypothetical protein
LFANEAALSGVNTYHGYDSKRISAYRRTERQFYEFANYNLNFGYFVRNKDAEVLSDVDSGHASSCDTDDDFAATSHAF